MPAHVETTKPDDKTGHPTTPIRATPLSKERVILQPKPEDYKGKFVQNDSGEEFALAVVESDPIGRTHKLRNDEHFWEGTKDEFRAQFEKA
jgi:hypothetical protein